MIVSVVTKLFELKKERDIEYSESKNNTCDNACAGYINVRNRYNKAIKFKRNERTQTEMRIARKKTENKC